jgi:hypothetical protein
MKKLLQIFILYVVVTLMILPSCKEKNDDTIVCVPDTIVPYVKINKQALKIATIAVVNSGDSVILSPQPNTGTWAWTGPNGFVSTSREVILNNIIASQSGIYIATNTVANGDCGSTQNFKVTVAPVTCVPNVLTHDYSVDGGGNWISGLTPLVQVGGELIIGPGPNKGSWSWTGPNGFTANIRQIDIKNIQVNQAGEYVATNTNVDGGGCISIETFIVTVSTSCVPYILTHDYSLDGGNSWISGLTPALQVGGELIIGPGPNKGTWSWSGPNGFTSTDRQIDIKNMQVNQAGNYVATNTNVDGGGCTASETFTVTVSAGCVPNLLSHDYSVDGGTTWISGLTPALKVGGELIIGPGPNKGTWAWTGPNGFTSTDRQIDIKNIQANQAGDYKATNTNVDGGGCTASETFTVTVNP